MAIKHITEASKLKAGDKVVVAPFGIPIFENEKQELQERNNVVGFIYGDDNFFPVVTTAGELVDNLVLVSATRDEFTLEEPENIGREIFSANDLPADYGVRVILRHEKYGDYRGFASNDSIDGWETVRLINDVGHGSFQFWFSDNFKIYLAVDLDYPYNF